MDDDGCRRQLGRMARIHNRLAQRDDLTQRLGLTAVSILGRHTPDQSEKQATHWQILTTDHEGLTNLARQLGITNAEPLRCQNQPLALIDPAGQLRALIPATVEPQVAALELARLINYFTE
jgi:hypothetical protein